MTPLYGHTSADTAYVVNNYPYGRDRTKCRFWIEKNERRGHRFCSQTQHPRKLNWNASRLGTYHRVAMAMYLDELNHVHFSVINEFSGAAAVLQFLESFSDYPIDPVFKVYIVGRRGLCVRTTAGESLFSINHVPQVPGSTEIMQALQDLPKWNKCLEIIKVKID